jgi:hypothetical protein
VVPMLRAEGGEKESQFGLVAPDPCPLPQAGEEFLFF